MREHTEQDRRAQLGHSVMQYLGMVKSESDKGKNITYAKSTKKKDAPLYNWIKRGTKSDDMPAPQTHSADEPKLRVSNLLSKQAANGSKDKGEGVDFVTDSNGTRYPVDTPLAQSVTNWHSFWKSPILESAVLGAVPAAAMWGFHKYLNPDDEGEDNDRLKTLASELLKEDEDKDGGAQGDYEYYMNKAREVSKLRRWQMVAGVWLASAMLNHAKYINTSDPSMLYKYRKTKLEKQSSMLGSQMAMRYNDLQSAVMFDPFMSPSIKHSALNALSYNPQPVMTSTNIINNAIYSGESAKTGLPIGRIITSAAVDSAVGYGLGKLLNVGSPKRAALLAGVGSALYNALSYSK